MCGGVGRRGAVTRVGRAPAEGGGGRGGEARQAGGGVEEGLVVEEECTLVDEGLDDCLVGACGSQGVHSGEVWPHESGPETDGQVFTGHQVHPVQLAHPVKNTQIDTDLFIRCRKNRWVSTTVDQQRHESDLNSRQLTCVSGSQHI